jgi:hypothetical protein
VRQQPIECPRHQWREIYLSPSGHYRLSKWVGDDKETSTLPQWCQECGRLVMQREGDVSIPTILYLDKWERER